MTAQTLPQGRVRGPGDRTLGIIGRAAAVIGIASAVVGLVWIVAIDLSNLLVEEWLIFNGSMAVVAGAIAWLIVPRQPRNGAVWPFAIVTFTAGLYCLLSAWMYHQLLDLGLDLSSSNLDFVYALSPSDLPTQIATVLMMVSWLFIPFVLLITVALVLFPDGHPPSPRWRWTVWVAYAAVIVQSVTVAYMYRPSSTLSYEVSRSSANFIRDLGPVVGAAEIVTTLLVPVCVAGLVVRFRRSSGEERQQFRVVVWGTAIGATIAFFSTIADLIGLMDPRWLATSLVFIVGGSYGIAIAKYRLYDVDVVISRTFVYGCLAVFIAVVYVGIVVGVSQLLGTADEANIWLGVAATVVIAIAFQPLRRWLQRVANRLVYGRRSTGYEVLSAFSQNVAAIDPEVLTQTAHSLTEGTTATAATIWTIRDDTLHRAAFWPEDATVPQEVAANGTIPGADKVAAVHHDGELLGHIGLTLPQGQPFPPTDEEILNRVSSGLGLALRNIQLTDDLQARVDQLRQSRRRVVAIQDQTRRMLERDLHDGAQQRLVALKIKIGLGGSLAEKSGLGDVHQILETVKDETDLTIEALRNLARGIYPPLLEAEGLEAALNAQLRRAPVPVEVKAFGVSRHSREIEATVYFCVLEAAQNASKHSRAESILVTLEEEAGYLRFEVRDDGVGFEPDSPSDGHGLQNVADRLDAINGSLEIKSSPEHGTQLHGRIPLSELVTP